LALFSERANQPGDFRIDGDARMITIEEGDPNGV